MSDEGEMEVEDPTAGQREQTEADRLRGRVADMERALDGAQRELARAGMTMAVLAEVMPTLPEEQRRRAAKAIRATDTGEHTQEMWRLLFDALSAVLAAGPLLQLTEEGQRVDVNELVTKSAVQVRGGPNEMPRTVAEFPVEGRGDAETQRERARALCKMLERLGTGAAKKLRELEEMDPDEDVARELAQRAEQEAGR